VKIEFLFVADSA